MADGYTPTTERVRDLFTWAYAWRTKDDADDTDLSKVRASNRAEFDRWLAEHDREVRAKAIEDAAADILKAQHFGHIVASTTARDLEKRAAAIREGLL